MKSIICRTPFALNEHESVSPGRRLHHWHDRSLIRQCVFFDWITSSYKKETPTRRPDGVPVKLLTLFQTKDIFSFFSSSSSMCCKTWRSKESTTRLSPQSHQVTFNRLLFSWMGQSSRGLFIAALAGPSFNCRCSFISPFFLMWRI